MTTVEEIGATRPKITHVILWSNGLTLVYDDHDQHVKDLCGKAPEKWQAIKDAVAFQDPPPHFDWFQFETNAGERIEAEEWFRRARNSKPDTMIA